MPHAPSATTSAACSNLVRVPLIIVDDFALKPITAPHDEAFHDVVAERYERRGSWS
ncbi:protein of unknown function (plasmid) [Caballeronia sp. S22]